MGILFPYHPMPLRFRCSSSGIGIWAYRAVFAATAAGYMGIPIIGTAAIGAAAVLSSQGQLIITAVLIVAVIGIGQQLYVSYNTIHSHVPVDLPQARRLLTGPRPAADRELRLP